MGHRILVSYFVYSDSLEVKMIRLQLLSDHYDAMCTKQRTSTHVTLKSQWLDLILLFFVSTVGQLNGDQALTLLCFSTHVKARSLTL